MKKDYTYRVGEEIVLFDGRDEFFGKVSEIRDKTVLCTMGDDKPIEFTKGVVIPLGEVEDLFDNYELLPIEVQTVLESFNCDEDDYKELDRLLDELVLLGYTFTYYLDGEPYWLRKI